LIQLHEEEIRAGSDDLLLKFLWGPVVDTAQRTEELSIPVDEEFQAAAVSSSAAGAGDVAFACGA
jgi:hypothetical protein